MDSCPGCMDQEDDKQPTRARHEVKKIQAAVRGCDFVEHGGRWKRAQKIGSFKFTGSKRAKDQGLADLEAGQNKQTTVFS